AKAKARADAIAEIADVRATLVLYESGPRLAESLAALAERLGGREATVARELTKLHEECVTGTLAELAARYADAAPKGEIVIVVGPPAAAAQASEEDLDPALDEALKRLSPPRAALHARRRRRPHRCHVRHSAPLAQAPAQRVARVTKPE